MNFHRSYDAHIHIKDANISRKQSEFVITEDGVELHHLSSSSETFVNDRPISKSYLMRADDQIKIGSAKFFFFYGKKLVL